MFNNPNKAKTWRDVSGCYDSTINGTEAAVVRAERRVISVGFCSLNLMEVKGETGRMFLITAGNDSSNTVFHRQVDLRYDLTQVWFSSAVHREGHILYRRCAILMKGKLLKLRAFSCGFLLRSG